MHHHIERPEQHESASQLPEELDQDLGSDLLGNTEKEVEDVVAFPRCVSETLSLRLSMFDYSDNTSVLGDDLTTSRDPETWYCGTEGVCLMPRRFVPINGYPLLVEGTVLSLRPSWCTQGGSLLDNLDSMDRSELRWVQRSCEMAEHGTGTAEHRISALYGDPPLHVFNSSSIPELASMGPRESGPWRALFDDMLDSPRKPGIYGVITNNSCVDMRPYEASSDYSDVTDVSRRKYKQSWTGFIDPSYTVASNDAGRIWSLVHKVRVRISNSYTLACAKLMASALLATSGDSTRDNGRMSWTVYACGLVFSTSRENVLRAAQIWHEHKGHSVPSLHVFEHEKVVTLSVVSGCLMRPLSVVDDLECDRLDKVHWVDSTVFNSGSMRRWLGLPADLPSEVTEYCSTHQLLGPYTLWNKSPRPALGLNMSSQAVCLPEVSIISTVKSLSVSRPIVRTPLMDLLCRSMKPDDKWSIPGANVVVLFANLVDTYEDSLIVNSRLNESGVFSTSATLTHPLRRDERSVTVGSKISSATHSWWRSGDTGVVVGEGYSRSKERYVKVSLSSGGLRRGDKVATCHGQKQTVSVVVDDEHMPICTDVRTGRKFTPDVVMAASSVHNRCTPGQVFEAWSGAGVIYGDGSGTGLQEEQKSLVTSISGEEARNLRPYECNFTTLGSRTQVMSGLGLDGPCVADYGVIRLWQLAHMSRDKQHFCSSVPRGLQGPKGKLFGSSVRIGESELATMMSKGWMSSVAETLDSSDMALLSVCSSCRRLSILCDCSGQRPPTTLVLMRSSLAKFDICRAVYTINANSPGATEAGVKCRPESFRYYT